VSTAAPSGVVTFLFTDIEGSTRRWEADADAMRTALAAHDDLMRSTVESHKGWLFKHTGDGVCAAFASPKAAVDAAVAAQRAQELPVRMGIATGEAELRGHDYFGAVLNRAARVMAAGHGGQVLIDAATAELLSDAALRDLGTHRLRDIARPINVFQVSADGLRSEFPTLRTLDSKPGNLRPQTTTFVGREAELADVSAAIKAHRLVTLTGVGGVGKTRLALEVAARSAHDFADGVFVVEFASIGDPASVPEAVAAALGIIQQPGMSLAESVAAALENRSRLLVFDNCEHVLDASAEIAQAILARSRKVTILATSREGLRLGEEQLWPVPSLDVGTSAAALFVDRAQAVAPAFSLARDDADAVAEICRRLDGIPLAIELAASRLVSMTVTEVRDRLDDRFRLQVGSRRGLERHQTLRHAVQWSYDLLDDNERSLLDGCSVFAGGFDLAAAHEIAGAGDDFTTLDLLDALVRKSLLTADQSSGRTRFSMLETIRRFAEEQLVADGSADRTRDAHARYFAGLQSDVLALWDSPRQREAHDWFAVELPNLRTAFRWAADHGDIDTAADITGYAAVLSYWLQQYEPSTWAEELIEPAVAVGHPKLAMLYLIAAQCYITGRSDDFVRYTTAGQEAVESGRYDEIPVVYYTILGGGYLTTMPAERCVSWQRSVAERYPEDFSFVGANLVFALIFAGAVGEAKAVAERIASTADSIRNPTIQCGALFVYGYMLGRTDPFSAYEPLRKALRAAQSAGNRQMESIVAFSLGNIATLSDDKLAALDYLALSIRCYYDSGSASYVSGPVGVLVALLDDLGRSEQAATISGFADSTISLMLITYPHIGPALAHLREVLGVERFEALSHAGARMTNAAMAAYALEQIDQARAQLAAREPS
jgi:predicted ATPase/class 3 adenylate cyclase